MSKKQDKEFFQDLAEIYEDIGRCKEKIDSLLNYLTSKNDNKEPKNKN